MTPDEHNIMVDAERADLEAADTGKLAIVQSLDQHRATKHTAEGKPDAGPREQQQQQQAREKVFGAIGNGPAVNGAEFAFSRAAALEPIWGTTDATLWAAGEGLMIHGAQGLGKTTLAHQLIAGRLGVPGFETLLGYPVQPSSRRVLYIAADRPRQAARAFRRLVESTSDDERQMLQDRLVVWRGPLPFDLVAQPTWLRVMADYFAVSTIVVDSLKDVVMRLTDDETGSAVNRAVQLCVANGIEVVLLHHPRKASAETAKMAKGVDDIYGSTFVTAGLGSILHLQGTTGDTVVQLHQLKAVNEEVGPLTVVHDHFTGRSTVEGQVDVLALARHAYNGVEAKEVAVMLFHTAMPNRNQVEKARRQLDILCRRGLVHRTEGTVGGAGGGTPSRYYAVTPAGPDEPAPRREPVAVARPEPGPTRGGPCA